ncbi:hypothetical protein HDU76_001515, partial [Blyttiomyces sp. JEL0837]
PLWKEGSPIHAWISVNGVAGNYGPFHGGYIANTSIVYDNAEYHLGEWRDVQVCYHQSKNDKIDYAPGGGFAPCPANERFPKLNVPVGWGVVDWFWNPPPGNEEAMMNKFNDVNVKWFVEVAFFNEKGTWDSHDGKNYKVVL